LKDFFSEEIILLFLLNFIYINAMYAIFEFKERKNYKKYTKKLIIIRNKILKQNKNTVNF